MYSSGASEPIAVFKEPQLVHRHRFLMNVFIQETPIEKNIESECHLTIGVTYVCKILPTMQIGCERVRIRCDLRMTPQQYQFYLLNNWLDCLCEKI